MKLDDRTARTERIRPTASTLDAALLLGLVRLRLDALRLSSGIVTLRITAATCPVTFEQRRLFPHYARRDPDLANQALARLRAEFGERSVVRARIGNAHLPAAQFEWEPLDRVPLRASPVVVTTRPLVRRIYLQPYPLATGYGLRATAGARSLKPETRSLEPGARSLEPVARVFGPYILSGGWWGGGIRRDYYFAPARGGNLWWVYYDHRRQRFFLQGCVE
jgi:protein ImuB